jgi:DNA replication protein DnaC
MLKKTGELVISNFRHSDDIVFKCDVLIDYLKTHEMVEIRNIDFYGSYGLSSSVFYEKICEDGKLIILSFQRYTTSKQKSHSEINLVVYSNTDKVEYQNFIDGLLSFSNKRKERSNNIALVISSRNGYETSTFELPKQKLDLELNYGKDFLPIHNKILTRLRKPKDKGLVLLHGEPGTGKTHYLKYLASQIKDKRVLFIPPHLVDFITSPEMTPFLIQNSNSILFIEDAEKVITDRNQNGSLGVSNILNLTDGILSDILNIQIVATFNMDKKKIDTALLRKGRLIAEHKFEKLSVIESNKLLKELNIDYITDRPMPLTEIYNIGEEEYRSNEKNKIGFLN